LVASSQKNTAKLVELKLMNFCIAEAAACGGFESGHYV